MRREMLLLREPCATELLRGVASCPVVSGRLASRRMQQNLSQPVLVVVVVVVVVNGCCCCCCCGGLSI
jgi:hypothetical protein